MMVGLAFLFAEGLATRLAVVDVDSVMLSSIHSVSRFVIVNTREILAWGERRV